MAYPKKICAICGDEFELKPGKPGFANHCPSCSEEESQKADTKPFMDADERRAERESNEARRKAMRDLLYRKES